MTTEIYSFFWMMNFPEATVMVHSLLVVVNISIMITIEGMIQLEMLLMFVLFIIMICKSSVLNWLVGQVQTKIYLSMALADYSSGY